MVESEPVFELSYETASRYSPDYVVRGYDEEELVGVEVSDAHITEEFGVVEGTDDEYLDVGRDEIESQARSLVDRITWGMNVSASDESLEELSVEVRLDDGHYEFFQEGRQDPFLGRRHEIDFVKELMESYIERSKSSSLQLQFSFFSLTTTSASLRTLSSNM